MYLFKNYCYPTPDTITAAIQSQFFIESVGVVQSVNLSLNTATINYINANGPNGSQTSGTIYYEIPVCTQPGFDNSYSGLTVDDAVTLGGLIMGVLAVAYASRIVRRSL